MARQQGDILAPLAQRRQAQADDIEAMEQVFAEQSLAHPLFQILVGGGDHPHVDLDRRMPADAVELAVRQHAQQAGLQFGRHVADFVQEQRAAVGLLEAAVPLGGGAGKGAALMAEEFGLQQVLGNGGGIERDERPASRAGCGGAAHARPVPCQCPIRR